MSHTHSTLYYHAVWSTKKRLPFILPNVQQELYRYMAGIIKNKHAKLYAIGGMYDHIHILFSTSPACNVSGLIRDVKNNSTRFGSEIRGRLDTFGWQNGYSIFSLHTSIVPTVAHYIKNQAIHHEQLSFQDELELLTRPNLHHISS